MNNNWLNKAKENKIEIEEIQSAESFYLSKLQNELRESIEKCVSKYLFQDNTNTPELSVEINKALMEMESDLFSNYFPAYTITVGDSNLKNQVSVKITSS